MSKEFILRLSCEDRPGIVARVSSFLASSDCNILDAQQFNDQTNNRFFMRIMFESDDGRDVDLLHELFAPIAQQYGMDWNMRDKAVPHKVVIIVSKFDHCLVDLLYRTRIGELDMEVVAIISNHMREKDHPRVLGRPVPFFHLPVTKKTKSEQEVEIRKIVEDTQADLVVLARYMQILSDDMARYLSGRCINIHHSFLPGFKGAKPYHQAFDRGVKMIGASGHFVTADLDEGPIIAQDVEVVSHADQPDQLVVKGRDVERRVLAKSVKAFLDDRVFLNGNRTVVFSD